MKTVLKVSLKKNQHYKYSNVYDAQVLDRTNISKSDIIDELLKEGIGVDKETVLNIITRFNKKVAEQVLSGNNVSTGLVNLSPVVKGSVNEKKWNPIANEVEIVFENGTDISNAMKKTTVEIIDEKSDLIEKFNLFDQLKQIKQDISIDHNGTESGKPRLNHNEDPACGIAFRDWLWKA